MKILIKLYILLLSTSVIAGYNPNNTVTYAQQWALYRNPQFKDFTSNDCTNFLSQTFRAGGFLDDKMYYYSPSTGQTTGAGSLLPDSYLISNHIGNWYYINGSTTNPSPYSFSETWSVANTMYRRLKAGYGNWYYTGSYSLQNTSNLNVNYGDVVFAEWDPIYNPGINHSMIVTGFYLFQGAYYPRLSYHSNDKLNNPFNNFKVTAQLQNPNTKLYVFRRSTIIVVPPAWQVF